MPRRVRSKIWWANEETHGCKQGVGFVETNSWFAYSTGFQRGEKPEDMRWVDYLKRVANLEELEAPSVFLCKDVSPEDAIIHTAGHITAIRNRVSKAEMQQTEQIGWKQERWRPLRREKIIGNERLMRPWKHLKFWNRKKNQTSTLTACVSASHVR